MHVDDMPSPQEIISAQQQEIEILHSKLKSARGNLRDQFAMAALTGILACFKEYTYIDNKLDKDAARANYAYILADQMMEARK